MVKQTSRVLLFLMVLACNVVYSEAVFVNIGNVNNAPDTNDFGAVSYNYGISETEVSISEFAASGLIPSSTSLDPVSNITWNEAAQYCNWLTTGDTNSGAYTVSNGLVIARMTRQEILDDGGLFYVLPTEDEWYKAAYYKPVNDGSYSLYANGTSILPTNGVEAVYGAGASAWDVGNGVEEQNGTYNMMGNVFEWLETPLAGSFSFDGSDEIVLRGGSVQIPSDRLGSDFRVGTDASTITTSDSDGVVGMRVVKIVPEPGTMSLMGLSTIGLFTTRTIRRRKRLGQSLFPVRREHQCDVFDSECEYNAIVEAEDDDSLTVLWSELKDGCVKLWLNVLKVHQSIDKAFWNRMVVVHERRVARRIRLRKALRKKALDGFDSFLMLIMK